MRSVLAIGGSDSSGGAGVQADVKALRSVGVHASTVVTAVTAQSSTAVHDVHPVPLPSVRAQLAAVLDDLGADVVKTGMLWDAPVVAAVVDAVGGRPLVVDPVGISSTGGGLLTRAGLAALRSELLPRATVVTPNLAEVRALTGVEVWVEDDLLPAARALLALGPTWVLVTGGHLPDAPVDLLTDGEQVLELRGARVPTRDTHGTGCTLAAALAGHLALGRSVPEAALAAKQLVTDALRASYPLGEGPGPVRA